MDGRMSETTLGNLSLLLAALGATNTNLEHRFNANIQIEGIMSEMNWIKCSERLPEPRTVVLAWEQHWFAAYHNQNQWVNINNSFRPANPSHWLAIEPPKEGQ